MESKTLTAYEKIDVVLKHFLWEYYDKREVFNNISGDFWIQLATKHNENPIENKQYILIADRVDHSTSVIRVYYSTKRGLLSIWFIIHFNKHATSLGSGEHWSIRC
jgi:hypothetical protein